VDNAPDKAPEQQQREQEAQPEPRDHRPERHDVVTGLEAVPEARARDADSLGRRAQTPVQIPWRGWKSVIHRTGREIVSDRAALVAAGCAFYATLALFPAITMLIFLYGLMFDPITVEPQLQLMRELLPASAFQLIADRVHMLVTQQRGTLTTGLVISILITLWSSATGTKSLITALNMAYKELERRSFLRYQLTTLGMTLCAIVGAALAIAIVVFVPAAVSFFGVSNHAGGLLIRVASTLVMIGFVLLSLSLLYRFGPCRRAAKWHWVTPGSLLATLLWLAASALFSMYVGRVASYDVTYGPLGAVAGMMMWFYVTAYVVVLGAELNSALELQTSRDSTEGPPKRMGRRGAYVADHLDDG
jgi:membrane protein